MLARLVVILLVFSSVISHAFAAAPPPALPNKVLWAWQRAENLSFIDPGEFAVAYMACRAVLTGDEVRFEWRNQPLRVPEGTLLIPTIRIDVERRQPCAFSQSQLKRLTHAMMIVARRPRSPQIQIDFDALYTEREFYRQLIDDIAVRLPDGVKLSITSLASWCLFDDWIRNLPVHESVPMMFSLGRERAKVLNYFRQGADFRTLRCCRSLGLSLEEPDVNRLMIPLIRRRTIPCRVYVFTKTAWNAKKVKAVQEMLGAK